MKWKYSWIGDGWGVFRRQKEKGRNLQVEVGRYSVLPDPVPLRHLLTDAKFNQQTYLIRKWFTEVGGPFSTKISIQLVRVEPWILKHSWGRSSPILYIAQKLLTVVEYT